MATKRRIGRDKPGQVPKPDPVQYPESEFSRFMRAKLVEVEAARVAHEEKWGIERITTLVPTAFREKFYAQAERIWAAQGTQDASRMAAACDGMIRAYKAMGDWAQAEGIEPITKVHAIEADTHLGIMVIVRDELDAARYMAIRKDVIQVWTVAEIVELVKAGIGQAIWELKAQLPVRSTVVAVQQESEQKAASEAARQPKAAGEAVGGQKDRKRPSAKPAASGGGSGFEDMENDLDLESRGNLPKMFQAPLEAGRR